MLTGDWDPAPGPSESAFKAALQPTVLDRQVLERDGLSCDIAVNLSTFKKVCTTLNMEDFKHGVSRYIFSIMMMAQVRPTRRHRKKCDVFLPVFLAWRTPNLITQSGLGGWCAPGHN